jgi:hypothetical protein
LLSATIQLRFDMWKICTSFRRPIHRDAGGVGAWSLVLWINGLLSVLFVFAMLGTYELYIAPDTTNNAVSVCKALAVWAKSALSGWSRWPWVSAQLASIVDLHDNWVHFPVVTILVIEHCVFAAILVLVLAVPAMPGKVTQNIQRRRFVRDQLVKQHLKRTRRTATGTVARARRGSMMVDGLGRGRAWRGPRGQRSSYARNQRNSISIEAIAR